MVPEKSIIRSIETSPDAGLIKADVQIGSKNHQLYFQSNDIALTGNIEAFLAAALLPAMKTGGVLAAEGRASQRLLDAMHTIMDIYCAWEPLLQRVEIRDIRPVQAVPPQERRIGTFFSGGVDSFYTLLKHRDEITDVIYVHGFDVPLDDYALRRRTSKIIHNIGASFGKRVIELETNIPAFLKSYFRYARGTLTYGSELVSVGYVLAPFFKRLYIAASHTYANLSPLGSHPLLDPLWSTETLAFIHDGCEATRVDKVALLSKYDVALQSLRVCFSPRAHGAYNCGLCEKCLRTMINLQVVGALDRCTAFNTNLDARRVVQLIVLDDNDSTRAFIRENMRALEKGTGNRRLSKALRTILNRPRWRSRTLKWLRHKGHQLRRFAYRRLAIDQDPL